MDKTHRANLLLITVGFIFQLFLSGCIAPMTTLNFKAAPELNPDLKGRPSPVVVKLYQLGSRTIFDSSDFFVLYDDPQSVLKGDLIAKDELEFRPGQLFQHKMKLKPEARYVGLVVAYRDISNSRWRAVIPADPDGRDDMGVYLEKLSIFFKEE